YLYSWEIAPNGSLVYASGVYEGGGGTFGGPPDSNVTISSRDFANPSNSFAVPYHDSFGLGTDAYAEAANGDLFYLDYYNNANLYRRDHVTGNVQAVTSFPARAIGAAYLYSWEIPAAPTDQMEVTTQPPSKVVAGSTFG